MRNESSKDSVTFLMMLLMIVHSNYVPGFTPNMSVEPARFRVYKLFFLVSLTTKLFVRVLIQ